MAIVSYKPYTPSRRFMTGLSSENITAKASVRSLLVKIPATAGRNNKGRITSRHKEKEKAKTAPQQPVEEIKTVVTPVSAPKIVGKIDLKEDGRKRFK